MAEFYSIEEIKNGSTYKLDTTTVTAIKNDLSSIRGKVVTLTGNLEVGFGSDGDIPLGYVAQIENENTSSPDYVVSVIWHTGVDEVACAGTETAGDFLCCDGKGGLKAAAAGTVTTVRAHFVDSTNKVCGAYFN